MTLSSFKSLIFLYFYNLPKCDSGRTWRHIYLEGGGGVSLSYPEQLKNDDKLQIAIIS